MDKNANHERGVKSRVKLARNVIFSGASSFGDFFLLLLLIAAGRFLGVEQFGTFSVALAATTFLVFSTNLGLDTLIIRYLAIDKNAAAHKIGSILTWKLILAFACTAVFLLLVNLIVADKSVLDLIYVLTPAALLRSFNMSFRSYIQAYERFEIEAMIVLFDRILIFLVGVLLLWMDGSALQLAWVFVIVRTVTLVILVVVVRLKICRFKLIFDLRFASNFQIEAISLGLVAIVIGLNAQIDVLMLSYFESSEEVGLFSSAQRIYEGCLAAFLILNPALYPRLSNLFVTDIDRHRDLVIRALKYLLLLGVPLASVGLLYSEDLIVALFGESYAPTATTLSIVLLGAAFYLLVAGAYNTLISIGQQKKVLYILLVGLLAKILLNLILIPWLGKEGAASSLAIATFLMILVSVSLLQKYEYDLHSLIVTGFKIVFAAFIGFAGVYFLDIPYLVGLVIFMSIYIACIFALRIFDRFELEIMHNVLLKIRKRH